MENTDYKIKNIDHHGLVAAFCQEIKLAKLIDDYLPTQSDTKNISYGELVLAMVLNGLGFTGRTLHMYSDYFTDKPLDRLLRPGIEPEHINDDALGRCLDKLYEHDVSGLYQKIGEKVVCHLGLACHSVHIDATSFHVDGNYEVGDDFRGVHLTKGYSRDHRPDLNQVILNLITENQAGLPVYMQACDGNSNDSENFKKLVKSHVKSLKAAHRSRYLVGDASLYVAETIQSLSEQEQLFITRVPQKIKEAKTILQSIKQHKFTSLDNGYSGAWVNNHYANIKQRWLVVRSEQAIARETKTLDKKIAREMEHSIKSFNKLCRQEYSCIADAKSVLNLWEKEQAFAKVSQQEIITICKHAGRGRPAQDTQGVNYYKLSGEIIVCSAKKQQAQDSLGLFILATNDCGNKLSMQAMLSHYKSQQSVEKGFRFLKSPDFLVSSFYLKKPERIEALLMVMTCCLMVYAAIEHQVRTKLREKGCYFPDMKKKPAQNPTARWLFYCFQGIHELTVDMTNIMIVNLKDKHKTVLFCLGSPYIKIYS